MLIGAHVGAKDPLAEAKTRNADLVQIFIANPVVEEADSA